MLVYQPMALPGSAKYPNSIKQQISLRPITFEREWEEEKCQTILATSLAAEPDETRDKHFCCDNWCGACGGKQIVARNIYRKWAGKNFHKDQREKKGSEPFSNLTKTV